MYAAGVAWHAIKVMSHWQSAWQWFEFVASKIPLLQMSLFYPNFKRLLYKKTGAYINICAHAIEDIRNKNAASSKESSRPLTLGIYMYTLSQKNSHL